jgi:crossover junction endodeoxyribonuclease RusA
MMLPYPISTNVYWRNFRGRMVRSSAATAYKDEVGWIAKANHAKLYTTPVMVMMILHPPRPQDAEKREKKDRLWGLGVRRIDIDNAQKVVLDALQGISYENDRQITFLSIKLGQPVIDGGLYVSIAEDRDWI